MPTDPPTTAAVKHRPIRPIAPGKRRARRQRARRSLLRRIATSLGVRQTIVVDGVRYRERSGESLRRALAPDGRGVKSYDVAFPTGRPMRIEATLSRHFDDIAPRRRADAYAIAHKLVGPGDRVLDATCGTGSGADLLARLVGPSGAVVATDADHQSIRFARRRYPHPNVAFEIAASAPVAGEIDAAFSAAFAIDAHALGDLADAIGELARVVAPSGAIVIGTDVERGEGAVRAAIAASLTTPHAVTCQQIDERLIAAVRLGVDADRG